MTKGDKDKDCKSCQIYFVCPVSYIFNNIHCPCWNCLVKVMCSEECQLFHTYYVNYLSYVHKHKRGPEHVHYFINEIDIQNMRQARDIK
jgi:hypothetical protein